MLVINRLRTGKFYLEKIFQHPPQKKKKSLNTLLTYTVE